MNAFQEFMAKSAMEATNFFERLETNPCHMIIISGAYLIEEKLNDQFRTRGNADARFNFSQLICIAKIVYEKSKPNFESEPLNKFRKIRNGIAHNRHVRVKLGEIIPNQHKAFLPTKILDLDHRHFLGVEYVELWKMLISNLYMHVALVININSPDIDHEKMKEGLAEFFNKILEGKEVHRLMQQCGIK